MTDERMGNAILPAVARLPRGAGIVFRHYATPATDRRRLFAAIVRIARSRGLAVIRAGDPCGYGEAGTHGASRCRRPGLRTAAVHDRGQAAAAARHGLDAVFVSPVFATRSHIGASPLGPARARRLTRGYDLPTIALGGMTARKFSRLSGFAGWAAIDAWS
ncbi:thiamine phosphate synthase [uncultured Sphingomonas sp.]|uniref:thiamine phosphate synthase n=1 Tax=uncultured Sphingomonas sp. TaxID=158754 RepID=UPI0035CAE50C